MKKYKIVLKDHYCGEIATVVCNKDILQIRGKIELELQVPYIIEGLKYITIEEIK